MYTAFCIATRLVSHTFVCHFTELMSIILYFNIFLIGIFGPACTPVVACPHVSTVQQLDTRWRSCLSGETGNPYFTPHCFETQALQMKKDTELRHVGEHCSLVLSLQKKLDSSTLHDPGCHCTDVESSVYSQSESCLCQLPVPGDSMYRTSGRHDKSTSSVEPWPPEQPITPPSNSLSTLMLFYCNLIMLKFPPRPDPVK